MKAIKFLIPIVVLLGLALTVSADSESKCKTNETCELAYFCDKPEGHCQSKGSCKAKPEVCSDNYSPVCGCDGQTYSNSCYAARSGVSIMSQGECVSKSKDKRKCSSNNDCGAGYFCGKKAGACDKKGECQVKPEVCTQVYDPVCGCNGRTYSNLCSANAVGENVQHEGECSESSSR